MVAIILSTYLSTTTNGGHNNYRPTSLLPKTVTIIFFYLTNYYDIPLYYSLYCPPISLPKSIEPIKVYCPSTVPQRYQRRQPLYCPPPVPYSYQKWWHSILTANKITFYQRWRRSYCPSTCLLPKIATIILPAYLITTKDGDHYIAHLPHYFRMVTIILPTYLITTKDGDHYIAHLSHYFRMVTIILPTYLIVRYHCGGWSEEVNSRILFLSYMVYL